MKIKLSILILVNLIIISCSIPPGGFDKKRCSPGKVYSEITKECEETGTNQ